MSNCLETGSRALFAAPASRQPPFSVGSRQGVNGVPAGEARRAVEPDPAEHRAEDGSLAPTGRSGEGEGRRQVVRPALSSRENRLRRRAHDAAEIVHHYHAPILDGQRIDGGAPRVLVGVADRAVEHVAEPPVEPHVHTSNVSEIGVRHPHDGALLLPHRIIDQEGPRRGERELSWS